MLTHQTVARTSPSTGLTVNDIHSRLNPTVVAEMVSVRSLADIREAVRAAGAAGRAVSICGGRHAMGGQQFGAGTVLLDMSSFGRVVEFDVAAGLITVEAGIQWPALINHLLWAGADHDRPWAIVQKQTGADRLSVGGAVSANVHGRGLRLRPFVADVESFDIVDAGGGLRHVSRASDPRLFALAVGGYGLFGVIARVTLRLAPRRQLQRRVAIVTVDDVIDRFEERMAGGHEYGDFQFATDPDSGEFLRSGVFSSYRPVDEPVPVREDQHQLTPDDWRRLIQLAHTDKSRAFSEYARHYMATDGQIYWSDTHQLAFYEDGYHQRLDGELGAVAPGSEMITELYVPRASLSAFMASVRCAARARRMDIIYGTVRLIERDDETVLAWARERWACVVFNLHVTHTTAGIARAAEDFRALIDCALALGGSYYLTYHRWARADQAERAHPRLREFLAAKRELDPDERFTSDWYRHHVRLLGCASRGGRA